MYDPALYDLVMPADFVGDIAYYLRLAREARGAVLELGAGTGRVTLPLADAGVQLYALDSDAGMLNALRRKLAGARADVRDRVRIVEGSMQDFSVDDRFALVICPCRTFQHNLTQREQSACFARVFEHLLPGGRFALNVFQPPIETLTASAGALAGVWRWVGDRELPGDQHLVRSEAVSFDAVLRRVRSRTRYEICDSLGKVVSSHFRALDLAYIDAAELRARFTESGFIDVELFGGFDERPLESAGGELIAIARRPLLG